MALLRKDIFLDSSMVERRPVTAKVVGSSPIWVVKGLFNPCGVLAQLGEHLPYKQRVIGSSPIGPIFMSGILKSSLCVCIEVFFYVLELIVFMAH